MFQPAHTSDDLAPETIDTLLPKMRYEGFYKKAVDVGHFYGFRFIGRLEPKQVDNKASRNGLYPPEQIALLRSYIEAEMHRTGEPSLLIHTRKVPYKSKLELRLDVIGAPHSTAEGILMQTVSSILNEYGKAPIGVRINSIGEEESAQNFLRDTDEHFKRSAGKLASVCREALKGDSLAPLSCEHDECAEARDAAPHAVSYLTDSERSHLWQTIEYLEDISCPYVIDHTLVRNPHYAVKTLFEFVGFEDELANRASWKPYASGERYDYLSKKAGLRRHIPAVGARIDLEPTSIRESFRPLSRISQPKAFLVHVGPEAKRLALTVGERLRQEHVPLSMSLMNDKLHEQMVKARVLSVPIIVIIGKKETVDRSAIVRNIETHEQDTVPLDTLSVFLKRRVRA